MYVIPNLIGNPIGYIARWIPAFPITSYGTKAREWREHGDLVYKCFVYLIEQYNDSYRSQKTLDKPCFHDDGRFVDALFFK